MPDSRLVNRAMLFSRLRFWRRDNSNQMHQNATSGGNFTQHMLALVVKLSVHRQTTGEVEFGALCKVFGLADRLQSKLRDRYTAMRRDPLPAEYHARQIALLYHHTLAQRYWVLEQLLRVAVSSASLIGRDEYRFLHAVGRALQIPDCYIEQLCTHYHIEIPSEDPYRILGIRRHASAKEIRQRYHQLVREYHPDKVSSLGGEYEVRTYSRKLAEINQAYQLLQG